MPTITKITEQKRSANRRSVYLDGSFAFGCNVNVVAKFRLREGLQLTAEQLEQILQGEVRQDCFDSAVRSLESRLHSRSELKTKLMRKEWGVAVIDGVLDDLQRMGYIDDARFAKTRALSAAQHKHHGKRRAMVELLRKGVNREVAKTALNDVYDATDTTAVARQLVQKQLPRLKKLDVQTARRRIVGMLQRRGFDYDDIGPVVNEALGELRDDSL